MNAIHQFQFNSLTGHGFIRVFLVQIYLFKLWGEIPRRFHQDADPFLFWCSLIFNFISISCCYIVSFLRDVFCSILLYFCTVSFCILVVHCAVDESRPRLKYISRQNILVIYKREVEIGCREFSRKGRRRCIFSEVCINVRY